MKLIELGITTTKQMVSPQSPGSRGLQLNKYSPARRFFDRTNTKKTNRQK
tara:strand:- start:116 stop:265 length:150 start_codon:yes stop_codon:yes gene_type:complete